MAYFQVLLAGEDFKIEVDGTEKLLGFVTTRWVKAKNEKDAELEAVRLIKDDSSLIEITKNEKGADQLPMIYLHEMYEVNWFTYFRRRPGGGYTFYPMENAQS